MLELSHRKVRDTLKQQIKQEQTAQKEVNIMTNWLTKAIFKAIKEHCTNPDNKYIADNKPVEFISMEESTRKTVRCDACDGKPTLTHYTVKTRHKASKYEDNISIWDVCIYSNGDCGIYFDGTEYRA